MSTSLRRLVVRNLSLQTVAEGIGLLCGLASSMVLSRHLDVAGFGAFNYAFAFLFMFLSLNDLGVNTILVREMSQAPERAGRMIGAALTLRLAIAAVVLATAWITIWIAPIDSSLRRPLTVFSLILPLTALNVPAMIFQSAMRFDLAAVATITLRVSGLALILLTVAAGLGVTAVLGALLVAEVIGLAAVYLLARKLVRFRLHVDVDRWRRLLRSSAPIGATLVLGALINRIDFMMLERMTSLDAVGLYSAAYRVTNMLEKLPLLVMATIYPVMSQLAVTDRVRLRVVYRKTVTHFAVAALPIGLIVVLAAPHLTALAFGESYRAAGGPLRYLVGATVCLYLALAGGNLLISIGRERDSLIALGAGAAANIGLNLVMIPWRGIEGAAMATAVSFLIVLVITAAAVERHLAPARAAAA